MAIINKSTNKKYCWGCRERGSLLYCWWECRMMGQLWKTEWSYLKKLKMDLSFDPEIPLPGIYPEKPKTLIWKNISTPMLTVALFTITKTWNLAKCPSVDEWIKQLWDFYRMEYYSATKKKKILLCNSIEGPGEHNFKWNKPVTERQIPYISFIII